MCMIADLQAYFKLKEHLIPILIFLTGFAVLGFSDVFFRSPASDQGHMIQIAIVCFILVFVSLYVF